MDLAVDQVDGHIYAAGYTWGSYPGQRTPNVQWAMQTYRFHPNGTIIWVNVRGPAACGSLTDHMAYSRSAQVMYTTVYASCSVDGLPYTSGTLVTLTSYRSNNGSWIKTVPISNYAYDISVSNSTVYVMVPYFAVDCFASNSSYIKRIVVGLHINRQRVYDDYLYICGIVGSSPYFMAA